MSCWARWWPWSARNGPAAPARRGRPSPGSASRSGWLEQDLTLAKVHMLLGRRGVVVPYRTLHRFAVAELGFGRKQPTVRVADGKPGHEVQVDFGRLGLVPDPASGTVGGSPRG